MHVAHAVARAERPQLCELEPLADKGAPRIAEALALDPAARPEGQIFAAGPVEEEADFLEVTHGAATIRAMGPMPQR